MSTGEDAAVTPEWAAYRAELLGLVGSDDPEAVQSATAGAVERRVAEASREGVLRTRPADGEWSVIELVGHLLDAEIFASARYRWILSEARPELQGYDQDRVSAASRHADGDIETVFPGWEGLRLSNLLLWHVSTPEQRAREGVHLERGPSTFELLFREIAGHDRFHLAQMDRTLDAVRPA